MDEMRRKNISKLDQAVERTAEIIMEHMSTLPLEKAKAMREEIRRLAAKPSRRAGHGKNLKISAKRGSSSFIPNFRKIFINSRSSSRL